jgi:hypothetical protein
MVTTPAETPLTTPALTVATPASEVIHVPPVVTSVRLVVALSHTDAPPEIGAA